MTTREQAFEALKTLDQSIATLGCAKAINGATRMHELDGGYGKLATAADVIAPLAASLWHTRHEAVAVSIPNGSYDWAVRLCEIAISQAYQIRNLEMRVAA